ncbi:MAG: 30S ribosomal protein S12 methylthiotransferase RimO [Lachnospiraceae bacterium]|nr:30S ribosomal protein S12 methylthiotransferase RimO [Lachnospiraceae bacterium]
MKILFISLGCDKNLVDTETMLGYLSQKGYEITDDETQAEAVVVNTCCFIHDAKQESVDEILAMADLKKEGRIKALIVTGCLAQRYQEEIQEEIPEVDVIMGTQAIADIVEALESVLAGTPANILPDTNKPLPKLNKRLVTTGGHYAYLKIAEGCDKHCTYCVIPKVRGTYRSVPMDELIEQAKQLVDEVGVKELILVAQETTIYGTDLYGEKKLPELLSELSAIRGLRWIRILYCYPEEIDDALIDAIANNDKVCHYLDIPVQHASDRILKRMGRRTSRAELEDIISKLRARIPDICLRTTLISGFPGETEEDHEEVMDFVDSMEFDRLGVFTYSKEEDTPAALMEDQIEEECKEERRGEIMELQQAIAFEKAEAMLGKTVLAMIEGRIAGEDAYIARTYMDAPGVDGYLFINTTKELMSGDFAYVRITGSNEYDLIGELEDEFSE